MVEMLILLARRWTNEAGDVWRLRGGSACSYQSGGGNPNVFRPPEAVDRLEGSISDGEIVGAHSSHLAHMHVGVFRGNQNHSDCSWVPA